MPATSEAQIAHLAKLNSLPQTRIRGFYKGHTPWNKGIKIILNRQCQFCGAAFQIAQSQINREAHRSGTYCSLQCFYNAKKKFGRQAQAKQLYDAGKSYKEIAENMGIMPSTVAGIIYRMKIADRYGDGIFMSSTRNRMRRLLADDGIVGCELCDYSRTTDVAHIIERKNGGTYLKDNCIVLCPNCHHLFDYNMLTETEKDKLRKISRLNGNLERRLK